MNQSKTYNIPGRLHSIGSEGIVAGADEILDDELNLKQNEINAITGTHIANDEIHVTAAEKEYWNSKVNPPSYSAPTAKQLTYTGEAQDLLNPGSSTTGNIQYSTDETNWSTTVPQETNAGTYTVYWRFVGSELVYVDSTAINVTIAKANPTYTAPTDKSGLVYNATAQDLLNAGSTSDGTISYSEDGGNWSSTIPSKTNAGDYTVYWKLTGDSNHNDVASTAINVSIAKVTPTVTAPTAKTGLVYDGTAHELVNAGSTDFGTLQYSLDNETYSTSVPSGNNAGDYSVYYKVVGDSNINDVSAVLVSCSIAKASRTLTFTTAPTEVDLGASVNVAATPSAGASEGTLTYSSGDTSKVTVSDSTVTGVGEGSVIITATITESSNYLGATASYSITVVADTVDLGLPSGTKWAKGNIVAKSGGGYQVGNETDDGAYVSWGNVQPHFSSNGSTFDDGYLFNSDSYSVTQGKTITASRSKEAAFSANSGYDVARQLLGGSWRLPTGNEVEELLVNCTSIWTNKNGVYGRELTSNINGKKVFFPACGFGSGGGGGSTAGVNRRGEYAYYSTSSYYSSTYFYSFWFTGGSIQLAYNTSRSLGCTVRAVQ